MLKKLVLITLGLMILFFVGITPVAADDAEEYPVYIVQPGDSLAGIALRFGVDIDELIAVNNITDPNALAIGTQLILPGLEGITGILTTINLPIGVNLQTLSIKSGVSVDALMRINKLSSPTEMYLNSNIIVPISTEETENLNAIAVMSPTTTLLEEAVKNNTSEWKIALDNQKADTWKFLPNQVLFERTTIPTEATISPSIKALTVSPEDIYQGDVVTITLVTSDGNKPEGFFNEHKLAFFPDGENTYSALQGIGAMHDIGLNRISISTYQDERQTFSFEQYVLLYETFYASETIAVDPLTLDPVTQEQEDERILELVSNITTEKYWNGAFLCVVDQPACIRSWYGTNRNYNAGTYYSYHTGIDYGVCATLNIYAPADGVVVLADSLVIRGNATYIDHGYGVYSAFFHQSEIWVQEGDFVKAGDIIGQIGTTGRSTGAHLHYDLIVNGEQIDPLLWLPSDCQ
jgi:murein DD-endopeptidase MepM/ murein hydrolase activator NlpD